MKKLGNEARKRKQDIRRETHKKTNKRQVRKGKKATEKCDEEEGRDTIWWNSFRVGQKVLNDL
jgi:hypothetical protein